MHPETKKWTQKTCPI